MPFLNTEAPSLENVESWVNSDQVNLIDGTYLIYFWNYSCSCCRDRLALFEQIHQNYSEIKVVGIHTPQLSFENELGNLERAVEELGIDHAVAHDPEKNVSESYDMAYFNRAVIVEDGSIVFHQGHSRETKELLEKINDLARNQKEIETLDSSHERQSHEFFGYTKTSGLNQEGNHPGEKNYQLKKNRRVGQIYLKGIWDQRKDCIKAGKDSQIRFNFESSKVSVIADPNDGIRDIKVLVDGKPLSKQEAGKDIRIEKDQSYLRVKNPGIYQLIDSEHQNSEITLVVDKNTELYALSFS